jgi:hypothetical protein
MSSIITFTYCSIWNHLSWENPRYVPEISVLCKVSTFKNKFLSDPKFAFMLEVHTNDTPAPKILSMEVNPVFQSIIDY